jgi:hypothetical protein
MGDGAFEKAWVVNCHIHRKVRYLFFKECWKCKILKYARNFREIRLMLLANKMRL